MLFILINNTEYDSKSGRNNFPTIICLQKFHFVLVLNIGSSAVFVCFNNFGVMNKPNYALSFCFQISLDCVSNCFLNNYSFLFVLNNIHCKYS